MVTATPAEIDSLACEYMMEAQRKRLGDRKPRPQPKQKMKGKVALVMSLGRLAFTPTFQNCFEKMQAFTDNNVSAVFSQSCAYWHHSLARNIEQALDHDFEYLFFIDGDSVLTNDDYQKMIGILDADPTIDALFPVQADRNRLAPLAYNWHFYDLWPEKEYDFSKPVLDYPHGHFGGAIIRSDFFRRFPQPWFRDIPDPDMSWGDGRIDADTYFWIKIHWMNKHYGTKFRTCMATDVVCGHMELNVRWQSGPNVIAQSLKQWQEHGKPHALLGAPLADHSHPQGVPWRYG